MSRQSSSLFNPALLVPAIGGAFQKLDPRDLAKNPVMFVVEVVAARRIEPPIQ
jgi:K+-transporting ATPase ATPase B chain